MDECQISLNLNFTIVILQQWVIMMNHSTLKTLKYTGCSIEQIRWGNNDDPREVLEEGKSYQIEDIQQHKWHTKYKVKGIDGWFNSVCFKE